jgi:hypothetical protein
MSGMLGAFGYHVVETNGIPSGARRHILRFLQTNRASLF